MSEHVMNGMTEKDYRAHPGVNKSTLWEIRKSPAHYKWILEHPEEDTAALKAGRAIHMAVLQPEEFENNYCVYPDGIDRRTKEGKAAWAALVEQNAGKEMISRSEADEIFSIADSVRNEAKWLLDRCDTEVPLFWTDDTTGIECKCRLDAIKETGDKIIVIDLKTTTDASTDAFTRSAIRYGYHVQAAHYSKGVEAVYGKGKPIEWWFVAVEKKAPYAVNLIIADDGFVVEGMFKRMELLDKLKGCLDTNLWPGYGINALYMPAWAVEEVSDE